MKKYGLGFPAVSNISFNEEILFSLAIKRHDSRQPVKKFILKNRADEENDGCDYRCALKEQPKEIGNCFDRIFEDHGSAQSVEMAIAWNDSGVKLDDLYKDKLINISLASSACALMLLAEIQELLPGAEDFHIQISAKIDGSGPASLGHAESVRRKARKCLQEPHTALIIHQNDFDNLRKSGDFIEFLKREHRTWDAIAGDFKDFSTADAFEEALDAGKRLFPLPVDEDGKWVANGKVSTELWSRELCRILGFPMREYVRTFNPSKENEASYNEVPENCALALFLEAAKNNESLEDALRECAFSSETSLEKALLLAPLPENNLGNPASLNKNLEDKGIREIYWTPRYVNPDESLPNIIISGPTGCGKTLHAQALLVNALASDRMGLYVGPTRALVEEVFEKFTSLLPNKNIILSTGEATDDDWRFASAEFDIACLVTEKANVILPAYRKLLDGIGYVIIDEIHMLANADRGGALDMLLAKLKLEQGKKEGRPMRIVAASTELPSGNLEDIPLYSYMGRLDTDVSEEVRPLVVASDARPQKVEHIIRFYCGDDTRTTEYQLGEFSSQNDRQKDDAWRILQLNRTGKLIEEYERSAGNESRGSKHAADDVLVGEIIGIASEHNRTIAVEASKGRIQFHANKICEIRRKMPSCARTAEPDANEIAAREFEQLLNEGELPGNLTVEESGIEGSGSKAEKSEIEGLGKKMVNWARYGVYIHHADLPRKARNVIEKVLRSDSECAFKPVALCTETLSYGVNLRADAIILCNLQFPRSDAEWMPTQIKEEFLTATEFHNIMGRVGRFNGSGDNKAYILINMEDNRPKPKEQIQRLLSWYCAGNVLHAATFEARDIYKFNNNKIRGLNDLSFISFRAVMDALRMAQMEAGGRAVHAADVRDMLDLSFYMLAGEGNKNWEKTFRKSSQYSGGAFVDHILELACDTSSSGGIPLVSKPEGEKSPVKYSLEKGAALIDTGMSWRNITPMANWLNKLKSLRRDLPALPVEFFLPALLACGGVCHEFLHTAFAHLKKPVILDDGEIEKWREEMAQSVATQLNEIFLKNSELHDESVRRKTIENFISQVKEFAWGESDFKDSVSQLCDKNRQLYMPILDILFLAMLAISLTWLNGRKGDMAQYVIHPALKKNVNEVPWLPARLFERMAWSAQMCANFFPEPFLATYDKGQLSRLVLRLRKGVPMAYLPLAQSLTITANQILRLKENRISCDSILQMRAYPADKQDANLPELKTALKAILNFYRQEYSKLEKRVAPKISGQLFEFMRKFLNEKKPKWTASRISEFAKACGWGSSSRINLEEDDEKSVLRIAENGKSWQVALSYDEDPADGCDAVCYLPWRQSNAQPGNLPVFTPGALFAACHFLDNARDSFEDLLADGGNSRTITFSRVINWAGMDLGQDALAIMEPLENS